MRFSHTLINSPSIMPNKNSIIPNNNILPLNECKVKTINRKHVFTL